MELYKTEYQMSIVGRIRDLRLQQGISQAELSRIIGISAGQLGNIESPKYPHKYTLRQISDFCEYIGYPVECIFVDDESDKSNISKIISNIIRYEQ